MIQNTLTEAIQATFPTEARPVEATLPAISPSPPTANGWVGDRYRQDPLGCCDLADG
jgi:hypothetical protein